MSQTEPALGKSGTCARTVFVHLVSAGGPVSAGPMCGQNDSGLCRRSYPTSEWIPGEIVRDEIVVVIADDAESGDYQLNMGFYLWATMTRLPASDAEGVSFADGAVPLGRLSVRAVTPP
jgi:hypothetical protein